MCHTISVLPGRIWAPVTPYTSYWTLPAEYLWQHMVGSIAPFVISRLILVLYLIHSSYGWRNVQPEVPKQEVTLPPATLVLRDEFCEYGTERTVRIANASWVWISFSSSVWLCGTDYALQASRYKPVPRTYQYHERVSQNT